MGLILATLLELAGCEPVTVVEVNARRRALAAACTGLHLVAPDELGDTEAEFVVDATGVPDAIEDALLRVAPGGTFMIFGVSSREVRVAMSPLAMYQRELTIVSSMAILHTYQPAVELVGRHPERFRPLLTHAFELADFETALATLSDGGAIKVTIAPRGAA
jgi:NADPH2:quinone reductase